MPGKRRKWLLVLFISLFLFLISSAVYPAENVCLTCHGVKGGNAPYVDPQVFAQSAHGSFGCIICHPDAATIPHPQKLARADPGVCAKCHGEITTTYEDSIHGKALAQGMEGVANCSDCHGTHNILPKDNPNSSVYPFNLPATCGKCHSSEKFAKKHNIPVPEAYQSYMKSIHGVGLSKMGLLLSATCNDCHGTHDIEPAQDPRSTINPKNLPNTCGKCHLGVLNDYKHSIHGKLWEAGSPQAPVCNDCHRTHGVSATEEGFKLASVRACGGCHKEEFRTYLESYHGQVWKLGYTGVAKCSDCHGYHKILPPTDTDSTLSPQHIVTTCRKCHPHANTNFAKFIPHADPKQGGHPLIHYTWIFMTILLIGVFGFFGVHTMLWAIRGYIGRIGGKR